MIDWIANALKKLTVDEFNTVLAKAQSMYRQGCKIIAVHRNEHKVNVTIQLASGERKLVVI